eukprot:m51a1_g11785 hypothetical protein (403) ;mRNA; f:297465-298728
MASTLNCSFEIDVADDGIVNFEDALHAVLGTAEQRPAPAAAAVASAAPAPAPAATAAAAPAAPAAPGATPASAAAAVGPAPGAAASAPSPVSSVLKRLQAQPAGGVGGMRGRLALNERLMILAQNPSIADGEYDDPEFSDSFIDDGSRVVARPPQQRARSDAEDEEEEDGTRSGGDEESAASESAGESEPKRKHKHRHHKRHRSRSSGSSDEGRKRRKHSSRHNDEDSRSQQQQPQAAKSKTVVTQEEVARALAQMPQGVRAVVEAMRGLSAEVDKNKRHPPLYELYKKLAAAIKELPPAEAYSAINHSCLVLAQCLPFTRATIRKRLMTLTSNKQEGQQQQQPAGASAPAAAAASATPSASASASQSPATEYLPPAMPPTKREGAACPVAASGPAEGRTVQ